jgi:hypothetical protein
MFLPGKYIYIFLALSSVLVVEENQSVTVGNLGEKVPYRSSIISLFSYCLEPARIVLRLHSCILANKVIRLRLLLYDFLLV